MDYTITRAELKEVYKLNQYIAELQEKRNHILDTITKVIGIAKAGELYGEIEHEARA